jgi:hypothetical protein
MAYVVTRPAAAGCDCGCNSCSSLSGDGYGSFKLLATVGFLGLALYFLTTSVKDNTRSCAVTLFWLTCCLDQ